MELNDTAWKWGYKEQSKGKEVFRPAILIKPCTTVMASRLGTTRQAAYTYLWAFEKLGIMRRLERRMARGQRIYSIGTWLQWKGDLKRRNSFITDTPEWREELRNFKPQGKPVSD